MGEERPGSDDERRTELDAVREAAGIDASRVSLPPDDESAAAIVDPTSAELGPNRRSEQYQMLGEVARGGVGIILRGHDVDLGRDVAMKVLRPDHVDRPTMIQRFIEEAQIGGQLQHPGIVPVYQIGARDDGRPFFTMKLVKGRTLSQLLKDATREPGERGRFLAIFTDICQTMAYAHTKGVIHRDLKPANVMVGAFGEVLVVDWGLAKVLHRERDARTKAGETMSSQVSVIETIRSSGDSADSDSLSGSVLGTPAYMAPEQARGLVEEVDPRSDVFALGCVLCEILTGAPPYQGSGREVLDKAARADVGAAYARLDACGADAELVRLCKESLAPAMSARPRDAGALAKAMETYLASVEERAHQAAVDAAESRQKRKATLIAAAALLVIVSGAWWTTARRAELTRRADAAIERHLAESEVLEAEGDVAAALAAVERVEELTLSGTASAGQRERLEARRYQLALLDDWREFLGGLAAIAGDAAVAADVEVSDETPEDTLAEMRRATMQTRDETFASLFEEWLVWVAEALDGSDDLGRDLLALPLDRAVTVVRDSGYAVALCEGLDAWAANRRGLAGRRDPAARRLLQIAMAADPHPERMALRQAMLTADADALRDLAADADPTTMADTTAKLMASSLIQVDAHLEALEILRPALRSYRDDAALQLLAATALKRLGRIEEAVGPLSAALAIEPTRLTTLLELGDAYSAAADFDQAANVFRDATVLHPASCEPWLRLAHVLGRQERDDERLDVLRRAIEVEPMRADAQAIHLDALARSEGPPGARAWWEAEVAAADGDAEALAALASAIGAMPWTGYDEALGVRERIVELVPESALAWRHVGQMRRFTSDFEGALEALERSLELDPSDTFALRIRAFVRNRLADDRRTGLDDLRAALGDEPDGATTREVIGVLRPILREEGDDADLPDDVWLTLARSELAFDALDFDRAETLAREAVRRAPELWVTHSNLAYVLGKRRGKRDEAIAAYEEFVRIRPDDTFALTNLAIRHIEGGDLDAALLAAGRAVGYAREPTRLAHLGEVYWRLGREGDARRLFDEARWRADARSRGNDAYARRTIARCFAIDAQAPRRQLDDAETLAAQYLSRWDDRDDAHELLGLVYLRLGRLGYARESLERARELQPDGATALTALLSSLVELRDGSRDDGIRWLQRAVKVIEDERIADPFVLLRVEEAVELLGG